MNEILPQVAEFARLNVPSKPRQTTQALPGSSTRDTLRSLDTILIPAVGNRNPEVHSDKLTATTLHDCFSRLVRPNGLSANSFELTISETSLLPIYRISGDVNAAKLRVFEMLSYRTLRRDRHGASSP